MGIRREAPVSVLIVDDDATVAGLIKDLLLGRDFDITVAYSGTEASSFIDEGDFDLLITDKNLPGASGIQLIRRAKEKDPFIETILVTGYPSDESIAEAFKLGVAAYLSKPFDDLHEVRETIDKAAARRREQLAQARRDIETAVVLRAPKK